MEKIGQSEVKSNRPEVIHFAEEDVVISSQEKSNKGLVADLPFLLARMKDFDSPAYDYSKGRIKDNTFLVSQEGELAQAYFIKQKFFASPAIQAETKKRLANDEEFLLSQKGLQGLQSILNEFDIAPLVQQALKQPHFQRVINRYGYDRMKLVEPLAGAVRKETGSKFLIYPKLNIIMPGASRMRDPQMMIELKKAFLVSGINAEDLTIDELRDTQEEPHTLYLTDIESYSKVATA